MRRLRRTSHPLTLTPSTSSGQALSRRGALPKNYPRKSKLLPDIVLSPLTRRLKPRATKYAKPACAGSQRRPRKRPWWGGESPRGDLVLFVAREFIRRTPRASLGCFVVRKGFLGKAPGTLGGEEGDRAGVTLAAPPPADACTSVRVRRLRGVASSSGRRSDR